MSSTKPLMRALAGERQSSPPIWLMRQAGRYLPEYREVRAGVSGFLELCYTPELAAEVTLQPFRRYDLDAAIVFADILLVPHAMGINLDFREGEGPVITPIRTPGDLAKLTPDKVLDGVAPVFETLRILAKELPEKVTLIGFAGSPWTVATYMVEGRGGTDFSNTLGWAWRAPDEFGVLIDLLVESTAAYLVAQIDAGAEAVQLFDSWAGALPEPLFRRWCIQPNTQITAKINAARPGVPVIGFPKGAGAGYLEFVRDTGVNAVSLDQSVPAGWAATSLGPACTVQGNLDPQALVAGGDALGSEVRRIVQAFSHRPHIFNLGHGIPKYTPPEHVGQLIDLVHQAAES
jgi:uroporphyrinogen decarboxylase